MPRRIDWLRIGGFLLIAAWCPTAWAQQPVCPPPNPGASYHQVCVAGGRFAVARLLADFAVDHVMRSGPGSIERRPGAVWDGVAAGDAREDHPELAGWIDAFGPLRFHRLDTSSGSFELDVEEGQRVLATSIELGEVQSDLRLTLPARLEGGYWRTPAAVQLAFWKGQRAGFRATPVGGAAVEFVVECLSISPDGIVLVTQGPDQPDVLVDFGPCE